MPKLTKDKAKEKEPPKCVACQGSGVSSKGSKCVPCRGSGVKQSPQKVGE